MMGIPDQPQPVTFWIIRSFHGYDGMSPKILGPFMTPEAAHHYAERDVRGDYIVKPLDAFMRHVPNEGPGVQGESSASPG